MDKVLTTAGVAIIWLWVGQSRGGSLYGTYPELSDSSPLDVGRGIYIPTTAVEQYFAELALWFWCIAK